MTLFSRLSIIAWFTIIALMTSISVIYYVNTIVFQKQTEEIISSEMNRIHQRMIQLQGTVNDFNRRHDYNAIHREVSRLSGDPSMDLIMIVDEHGYIKYSSLIEYRNTLLENHPEIKSYIHANNTQLNTGSLKFSKNSSLVIGTYPLDHLSDANSDYYNSYLFARFDLDKTLQTLQYRQQQEIIQITIILFILLFSGFFLLYIRIRSRIKIILNGISLFSTGKYDTRIKLSGVDEFSKISNGFDSMATKLQVQNQGLTELTEQLKEQHQEIAHQELDLRVTLNSIGDAVIATDSDGIITRMNPIAEQLTGWTLGDAIGKSITTIFNIIDAESRKEIENPIEKVIQTGKTIYLSNNTTLISRDGMEYQISDSAAPIRNELNIIQGMVLIFNDVTEQYRLRSSTAKSEQLVKSIMNNSPAVIYVKDINGEFTYVNQKFLTIFNLKDKEVIGKTLDALFPDEVANKMHENDKKVLSSGSIIETDEIVILADGTHTYNSIKFPLTNEAGEAYAVCGISTDITERKQQEQQIRHSQKMDALGKLTGGIAHDYNNMLGIIMGYSELLQNALSHDDKLKKFAGEIYHAGQRGTSLTKKLLSFSRPHKSENEILNINSLLSDRRDMLEKVLTARIDFKLELDNELWPVSINSGDLEDSIINISINAMHAMQNKGKLIIKTKNIHLNNLDASCLQINQGDYVLISFTDTGFGMNKEVREKIFEPFFTSKGKLGVGLGLSQVYGLVQSNDGAIKVESELDQGTCISIYLPKHTNTNADNNYVTETSISAETLTGTETILVVDDEPSLRSLTAQTFTLNGYTVLTAENGKQALEIIKNQSIDILLTDIIMPEMDGYELSNIVEKEYPNIKIQLVTGYNETLNPSLISHQVIEHIIYKPFKSNAILARIKKLVRQPH